MSDRPIAFLDSGIGGAPYLSAAMAASPDDRFVYYADNRNFPYGERSVDEVRELVVDAVERLVELADPRAIVVACNTASVVALDVLRSRFDVPFVGVVPAALVGGGRIGVLATTRTVEDEYVARLIRTFAPENEVELVAAGGLVELIEQRLGSFSRDELDRALEAPAARLLEREVDAVVLGCTHFIHVRADVERLLGDAAHVIDSVDGVVRQTLRVAGAPRARTGAAPHDVHLFLSDASAVPASYRYLARTHGMKLSDAASRHSAHR
ncbi:MAG: glutamate racemase [Spirochaetota bacterium]